MASLKHRKRGRGHESHRERDVHDAGSTWFAEQRRDEWQQIVRRTPGAGACTICLSARHDSSEASGTQIPDAQVQDLKSARYRAAAEEQRTKAERERADALEAELTRLKAQLTNPQP